MAVRRPRSEHPPANYNPVESGTRLATMDDLLGIVTVAEAFPLYEVQAAAIVPLIQASITQGGMFVAVDRGQINGFLCALLLPHPFSGRLYVDVVAFFVVPSCRLRGAALGLLRKMLRWTDAQQLDMVKVAAPIGSHLGTVLLKLGFRAIETAYLKGDAWNGSRPARVHGDRGACRDDGGDPGQEAPAAAPRVLGDLSGSHHDPD